MAVGRERARDAWLALLDTSTRTARHGRLVVEDPPLRPQGPAPVWPLGQVLTAAIDLAYLDGDYRHVDGLLRQLERYRTAGGYASHPGGRDLYYDDNAWLGLAMFQLWRQRGDAAALAGAQEVFEFVAAGEEEQGGLRGGSSTRAADPPATRAKRGGIRWRRQKDSPRNTCSTAPAMQLALRLHKETGHAPLLEFALRCDAFLESTLASSEGLFWDHVDADGTVDRTIWSYNQGTVVGARMLLATATGNDAHTERAARTLEATLEHFGEEDRWWREPPAFVAICLRNLLAAAAMDGGIDPTGRVRSTLDSYLAAVWERAREPHTGLCRGGGIGSYEGSCIDQAAIVQLLALAEWPPERLTEVC